MKAVCWHGKKDIRVETVPDPEIINEQDAIIRVTATAICGSDLHLYNGLMPTMESGDILGHEFMGEVVELSPGNKKLKIGDKVVVPFSISCGKCNFCKKKLYACCELSNPNAEMARQQMGQTPAGMFGYSHLLGGFSGGQAEYVRVPFSNIGPIKVPEDIPDEKLLFLSDIFPTGYMAAENCGIQKGDTVAIWGCGPVGQFAIQSAWMLGAQRVIAIDCVEERLKLAEKLGNAETINFKEEDVFDALMVMTRGLGPERCIDAVGCEAHVGPTFDSIMDRVKQATYLTTDRAHVLREAIRCCAKAGTISMPGVYLDTLDNIPFGAAMNKGLTFRMGQTHVQRYLPILLRKITAGEIDPSKIITHRIKLKGAPEAYKNFEAKDDGCIKVVMTP
ncbi:zinc-dependent alcohol dehydrogenase [Legionella hackeliae]|uniref:S-(Hydroxymethyl)glutathione dehydrogenase n=1 Tax=Legionella hackeliae TaxID=449 RepID=A0A0A8UTF8_LEGHA|nr:zinc-dependent alcohol dehydrogenase [Legionella hackeliae]KTD10546.1 threonine(-3-)dehydrogenase [Legionella hackeliae]CEK10049.1 S-(hydroxymethyl)glutathione dehydrogenase [Legionella hackeliae]STX46775.1 threonine(-3-)dehydrogenase [Legionella hackeliae]